MHDFLVVAAQCKWWLIAVFAVVLALGTYERCLSRVEC